MPDVLHVLVVDDEAPARDDLVWLLERQDDIAEIEQAASGAAALRRLGAEGDESPIHAVFLDLHMPDFNGIEVARTIARFERPPAVVFVTAFDTPAADAFELGVIDYLRKPVAADRLDQAVQRVLRSLSSASAGADLAPERLSVATSSGRQLLLRPDEVTHFESSGDYVRVHAANESYLVRDTMARLTEAWGTHGFVRIHRSYTVRLAAIAEVRSGPAGRSVLLNDSEIPVSRRYARELTAALSSLTR